MQQAGFIFKVLVISAGLSFLIKNAAPHLPIWATPINVLALVWGPTLLMAILLWWRATKNRQLS